MEDSSEQGSAPSRNSERRVPYFFIICVGVRTKTGATPRRVC